jgi:hypothetical protein
MGSPNNVCGVHEGLEQQNNATYTRTRKVSGLSPTTAMSSLGELR